MIVAIAVSTTDTAGFASPPVPIVEAIRLPAAAPLMAVAVPPPAIMARLQVITGSIPVKVETMTAVPAKAARGIARESRRLSTQGIE